MPPTAAALIELMTVADVVGVGEGRRAWWWFPSLSWMDPGVDAGVCPAPPRSARAGGGGEDGGEVDRAFDAGGECAEDLRAVDHEGEGGVSRRRRSGGEDGWSRRRSEHRRRPSTKGASVALSPAKRKTAFELFVADAECLALDGLDDGGRGAGALIGGDVGADVGGGDVSGPVATGR